VASVRNICSMSENHIRGISTTLALLDKALCEFDQWAKGREIRSVLYQVLNPLSEAQRQLVAAEISQMKGILEEIRDTLHLEVTTRSSDKMITSSCSVLWTSLVEMESRHLRRYGVVPPDLADFIDPRAGRLNDHLQKIAGSMAGKGSRQSKTE
jgi:hypothetical protein